MANEVTLALEKSDRLFLGRCPRCGAVLRISNARVNGHQMCVCPMHYRGAKDKNPKPCGFLWYAPWSQPVIDRVAKGTK